MIRKNLLKCNLIQNKFSAKFWFDSCMKSFRPEQEVCPFCKRMGDCRIHAYYFRYVIDSFQNRNEEHRLRVMRVICSCGHTHAILPDPIIPYRLYSLFFILRVILVYHRRGTTVCRLCNLFHISESTLYRWLSLYELHRTEWQGLLAARSTDALASLTVLRRTDPFCRFANQFIQKTNMSFLQSHKNPANTRRSHVPPDFRFEDTT